MQQQPKSQHAGPIAIGALAVLLVAIILVAILTGKYPVTPGDILAVVMAKLSGGDSGVAPTIETVIWNVRLPRVGAGILVGASLAAAGAAYQGQFRNPLVSPDILGVSAGASFGAVVGIFLTLSVLAIQGLAFAGGLAAVALVYAIGSIVRERDPILVLVLAGVAIGALLGACVSCSRCLPIPTTSCRPSPSGCSAALPASTAPTLCPSCPRSLLHLCRWRCCAGA